MPRYRVAFAREWTLGRWGYLDRFFHDLGGHQSEPSGLDNAWIIEYRGQPRHLGRELARALNVQEADFRKFGPIFDIEELPPHDRKPSSTRDSQQDERVRSKSGRRKEEELSTSFQASDSKLDDPAESQEGPSWVANTEVEDADLVGKDAVPEFAPMEGESGFVHTDAGMAEAGAAARAQARWDDLFRIRQRSNPSGQRRAEAIAGASRRRVSTGRPSSH